MERFAEDVAYVGLGLVLAVSALVLLVFVALSLGEASFQLTCR